MMKNHKARRSLQSLILTGVIAFQAALVIASPPLFDDSQEPIAQLWYTCGAAEGESDIAVYRNGHVCVKIGDGSIWGQLTPQEAEELVAQILELDGLSKTTTEEIQNSVSRYSATTGLSCHIPGAEDTCLKVRQGSKVYQVRGHAVGIMATRFPQAEELRKLNSAQQRMENIRAIIMAGGMTSAKHLAELAQQKLAAEHGESIPVSPKHLTMVRSLGDGTRFCQFAVRHGPAETDVRLISVFETPGESPRVSVIPDGPILR